MLCRKNTFMLCRKHTFMLCRKNTSMLCRKNTFKTFYQHNKSGTVIAYSSQLIHHTVKTKRIALTLHKNSFFLHFAFLAPFFCFYKHHNSSPMLNGIC